MRVDVLGDHARRLQLVLQRPEVDPRTVGDVGGGGEDPQRREAERENRAELDDVAGALADGELSGVRGGNLWVGPGRRALNGAEALDEDPQEIFRTYFVQP